MPEVAARSHLNYIDYAICKAIDEANISISEIDIIAATGGPGLIGGVMVGTMYGKTLSSVLGKPYVAVNHLRGHALTVRLTHNIQYPYLLLLVSGGHCQFIAVFAANRYIVLGRTLDDAVGEAFDKVSKMLGFGYPGGPIIENLASTGDTEAYKLPLAMTERQGCDMSFSGLKTAVRVQCAKEMNINVHDMAASFQHTVAKILANRLSNAIGMYLQHVDNNCAKQFVISGGVASNMYIRTKLNIVADKYGFTFCCPPINLCTDNAAMIAHAGYEEFIVNGETPINFKPRSRWSIE
jgi:N6-L-threonylcarbamoyladenine synthase